MTNKLHVCYVLVAKGWDRYSQMAWISAKAVRLLHPDAQISLVLDTSTKDILKNSGNSLLELMNDVIAVDCDIADLTVRSRHLKLQIRNLLRGDFLHLDVDTVPIRPFADVMEAEGSLAAAIDFNANVNEVWQPDPDTCKVFQDLHWPIPRVCYNAGIFLLRDNDDSRGFMDLWRRRWEETKGLSKRADHLGDQFAFNRAIVESGIRTAVLSNKYNAMVAVRPWLSRRASVLHFFSSPEQIQGTLLDHLLKRVKETGEFDETAIKRCIDERHPWGPNSEPWQFWRSRNYIRAIAGKVRRAAAR
ncbi:MAG: hypothetical protein ACJ8FY_19310 [Gemmataceae bacterium]